MQVKVIQLHEPGPALGLRPASLMLPPPAPDALTTRHTAIDVSFVDAYHHAGLYPVPAFPAVLGIEGVDVMEAIGTDVRGSVVGQRTAWAGLMDGTPDDYTSYRDIPAERAIALPGALDDETVATALVRGITAYMLLTRVRQVSAGDTVLVHATANGLSVLLVQWARRQGAHVIGTAGSEAKTAVAIEHGADRVVLYHQQDVRDAVLQLTGGEGVDYVIDGAGSAVLPVSLAVTRLFGIMASIDQAGGVGNVQTNVADLTTLGSVYSIVLARPSVFRYMADLLNYRAEAQAALQHILDSVRVPVGDTYALEDATVAYTALEAGWTPGALFLRP